MATRMPKHRDEFIDLAVDVLQSLSLKKGYVKISKETLAFILQRYVNKYESPSRPYSPRKLKSVK